MSGETTDARVIAAIESWMRWLPTWQPGAHRTRIRVCRRCVGSPIVAAANIEDDVPHQVTHALVARMQRIIDTTVDEYTEKNLPHLHAELASSAEWHATPGYRPAEGLPPEYDGLDVDPLPHDEAQPFLFTLAELARDTAAPPPLPRPPLTAEEKLSLRHEIELADQCAIETGQKVCFALAEHSTRIRSAIERFVEPQIQQLLDELSQALEPPG